MDILHTIFSYYGIEASIFSYMGGISIIPLIYLFITSFSFQFCNKHRLPLYYIIISNTIALYDTRIGITITDKQMLCTYLILFGVMICTYLFYNQIFKKYDKFNKKYAT